MSPRDEARTPRDFFDRLDERFGFSLDAACNEANALVGRRDGDALAWPEVDALREPWSEHAGDGAVWLNPPYSDLEPWLFKARAEGLLTTVVALLPADPSTAWWQEFVRPHAAEVLFVVGRLRFLDSSGRPFEAKGGGGGFRSPSAVVVWRPVLTPIRLTRYGYVEARAEGPGRGAHRLVSAFGETRTLVDWARRRRIPRTTIAGRLDRGWEPERALTEQQFLAEYQCDPRSEP